MRARATTACWSVLKVISQNRGTNLSTEIGRLCLGEDAGEVEEGADDSNADHP